MKGFMICTHHILFWKINK